MHKYYLLERAGRKWVAVAAIVYSTPNTCQARAAADLRAAGYPMSNRTVRTAERAESEKNWGGHCAGMVTLQGQE